MTDKFLRDRAEYIALSVAMTGGILLARLVPSAETTTLVAASSWLGAMNLLWMVFVVVRRRR